MAGLAAVATAGGPAPPVVGAGTVRVAAGFFLWQIIDGSIHALDAYNIDPVSLYPTGVVGNQPTESAPAGAILPSTRNLADGKYALGSPGSDFTAAVWITEGGNVPGTTRRRLYYEPAEVDVPLVLPLMIGNRGSSTLAEKPTKGFVGTLRKWLLPRQPPC